MKRALLLPLLGSLLLVAPAARATPFTLPRGKLAFDVSVSLDSGSSQWTDRGVYGPFPLNGRFASQTAQLNVRYGILDNLELAVRGTYKNASYDAAPIHLFPARTAMPTQAELTGDVIHFSGVESGFSDAYVSLSYRPVARAVYFAIETELKIPTGYRAPSGTFCDNIAPADALARVAATLKAPQTPQVTARDFCTGVTLGDGQVDWLLLGQLGKYIPQTRTFLRLDGGMNFRFQGPGQQAVGSFKIGENLFDRVLLFAGTRVAYTVNRGAVVGTTVNTTRPAARPEEYPIDGSGQLLLLAEEAVLDRSYLFVDAGVIVRFMPAMELRASYSRAVWGRNFPEVNSISLGAAFATQ